MPNNSEMTTKSNGAHVLLSDSPRAVVIKDLRLPSTDVYDYLVAFDSSEQIEEELKRAIDVGVAVLQKVKLVSDSSYFDKKVEQLAAKFESNVDDLEKQVVEIVSKRFDPAEAKSYTRQINEFFQQQRRELQDAVKESVDNIKEQKDELEELIEGAFDADDKKSHLGKLVGRIEAFESSILQRFDPNVKTSVPSVLQAKLEGLLDRHLSVTDPDSPFVKFKEEVRQGLAGLREELAKYTGAVQAKEEAIQKSPEKGYIFEYVVHQMLQEIAHPHADLVTDVSKEIGETKRKSGDFLYEVSCLHKSIVVEARSKTIASVKSALSDLDSAMQNRGAEYGIYVVESDDQLQKQNGMWNEYPDNKIITHAALLEVAVKVAKARLALEQPENTSVDISTVRTNLQRILDSLKKLSSIKKEATTIRGSGDKIELLAAEIQSDIQECSKAIEHELTKGVSKEVVKS